MIKKYLIKIFRKISYSFFLKVYGTIENSIENSKDNRIKVKKINIEKDLSYKVYIIWWKNIEDKNAIRGWKNAIRGIKSAIRGIMHFSWEITNSPISIVCNLPFTLAIGIFDL